MLRTLYLLILFVLTTGMAPSFAAAQNNDQARLKTLFESVLNTQKAEAQARGSTLVLEGDIQIENAGHYYAVTLPHASLKHKDGSTMEIGMIAVNASPQQAKGVWKMTIALPTPFILKDKTGTPLMSVNIGGQNVTGTWNEAVEYFTQLNASYTDVTAEDMAKTFSLKLPMLSVKSDLKETTPGKWSGPMEAHLQKLDLTIPQQKTKISLESATAHFDLLSYDPLLIKAKRTELAALRDHASQPATDGQPLPAPSPEHMSAVGQLIFDLLTKSGEGFKTTYALKNLEIIAPQPGQEAMGKFGLEKGLLSIETSGFSSDKVSLNIGLDYDGLDPRPLNEQFQNLLAKEAHISWALKNVPLQQLAATLTNAFSGMAQGSPAMTQMTAAGLMFKIPAILSQAQTSLVVEKNFMMNDLYRTELNGQMLADITAATGFTSDFVLGVYGLDNLIIALENAAANPNTMYRKNIQGWAANLKYFKGFGVKQKDDQATPLYRYHFQMTPQGQMLLNEKDAASVFTGSFLPPLPADAAPAGTAQ